MNALILFARIEAGRQTCQILMENRGIGFDDGTGKTYLWRSALRLDNNHRFNFINSDDTWLHFHSL